MEDSSSNQNTRLTVDIVLRELVSSRKITLWAADDLKKGYRLVAADGHLITLGSETVEKMIKEALDKGHSQLTLQTTVIIGYKEKTMIDENGYLGRGIMPLAGNQVYKIVLSIPPGETPNITGTLLSPCDEIIEPIGTGDGRWKFLGE